MHHLYVVRVEGGAGRRDALQAGLKARGVETLIHYPIACHRQGAFKDLGFAADQFRQFIKSYPTDPQAADATNWLGEALLQQQDYVNAADILVTGYKTYPDSPRAPDMLLKLGIALAGAQQQDAACKTFGLLAQKYPSTTTAFKTRLKQEMARGKCAA